MKSSISLVSLVFLAGPKGGAAFLSPSQPSKHPPTKLALAHELIQQEESKSKQNYNDAFIKKDFEQQSLSPSDIKKTKLPSFTPHNKVFPLSQVVNQDSIKQALLLAATNPRLGSAGILIGGGHGTCKSVLARSASRRLRP